ncbi:transporter substrate-binding domain-containing protein [Thermodesulfobacteriota bacterium]
MVGSGTADVHAGVYFNEERDKYLDYGAALTKADTHYFRHISLSPINVIGALAPYRVGVIGGAYVEGYLKERLPQGTVVPFADYDAMMKALQEGTLKVFVASTPSGLFHLAKNDLLSEFTFSSEKPLYQNDFLFAVQEGNHELLEKINQGMALIADEEKRNINRRWIATGDEIGKLLIIAIERNYAPLTFVNALGRPSGLLVDMWRTWAQKAGRQIQFRPSSWTETLDGLRVGEVDIHSGLSFSRERTEWIDFSTPIYKTYSRIYHRIGDIQPSTIDGYGKSVLGTQFGTYQEAMFWKTYPNISVRSFASTQELIEALLKGEIKAIVQEEQYMDFKLDSLGLRGDVTARPERIFPSTIHAGVPKGKSELIEQINKGFSSIPRETLADLETRWISNPKDHFYKSDTAIIILSPEERSWLADHPVIRVGIMEDWPPMNFVDEQGNPQGVGVDYIKVLNERLKGVLTIVPGQFKENFNLVKDKKLDALMDITPKKERESFFNFTTPYLTIPHVLVGRKDGPYFNSEKDLTGKTIALERGFFNIKYFRKNFPEVAIKEYSSTSEALGAVSSGKADAYAGNRAVVTYLLEKELLANLSVQGRMEKPPVVLTIGVRKDWPTLARILERAFHEMTNKEKRQIHQNWLEVFRPADVELTREEKAWLAEHRTIRIGTDPAFGPFEFTGKDGKYQGIAADFVKLIGDKLGLKFESVSGLAWKEVVEKAKQREIDVLPCVGITEDRKKYFAYSKPYLQFPRVIITRNDGKVQSLDDLRDLAVAVQENSSHHGFLKDRTTLEPVLYDTFQNAMLGLSRKEVDAVIGNLAVATHTIQLLNLANLKIAAHASPEQFPLAFAVRKDWQPLVPMLDKALGSITEEETYEILQKWVPVQYSKELAPTAAKKIDLTQEEKAWLANHPSIRLGFNPNIEPILIQSEDGELTGILPEIYGRLQKNLSIDISIEIGPWHKIIERADKGELDGLLACAPALADKTGLLKTTDFFNGMPVVFAKHDAPFQIKSLDDLKHKKIAHMKGIALQEKILAPYRGMIDVLETGSTLEAMTMVLEGSVDVALGTNYDTYLLAKNILSGIKPVFFDLAHQTRFHTGIRTDWPELVGILNKGLAELGESEISKIVAKWTVVEISGPKVVLTEEEKTWLAEHPVIRMAMDPDWAPVEFADEQGRFHGISMDYLQQMSELLGVRFEPAEGLSWQEAVKAVESGELDFFPCMASTPERERKFNFTAPYLFMPINIFAGDDVTYISNLNDLAGKRVAVVEGYATHEWLQDNHPGIKLVPAKTIPAALKMLAAGEAYAFVGNGVTTTYYISKMRLHNIRVVGETPYKNAQSMGVRQDWPILANILQKALDAIPQNEREAIFNRWFSIKYEYGFDYTLLWKVLIPGFLVIVLIFYWNRRLSREVSQRKQSEAALLESQSQFRRLVEYIGDDQVYFSHDLEGHFLYASPIIVKFTGIDSNEIVGKLWWDTIRMTPETSKDALRTIEACLQGETPPSFELHFFAPDTGEQRILNTRVRPGFNQDGIVDRVEGVARDVTDRIKADKALRESEERLQMALNASGTGVFDWDLNKDLILWDERSASIFDFGTEPTTVAVEDFFTRIHSDDAESLEAAISEIVEKGQRRSILYRVIRPDGSIRHIDSTGMLLSGESGLEKHMIGTNLDVTERKEAEQALREIQERNMLLLQSAGDAIFGMDMNGKLEFANDSAQRLLGWGMQELLGVSIHKLIHHSHADGTLYPEADCFMSAAFRGGIESQVTDEVLWRKDGSCFPVEYSARPILRNQEVIGAVVTFWDITERKAMEDQILQAKEAAETANRAKSVFLANMSHEIRTPMNAILGYSQLMQHDPEITASQEEHLNTINRSGGHLLGLINDILEMSKIEAGRTTLNPGVFDFPAMLVDMEMMFRDRTEVKNLLFQIEHLDDIPQLIKTDEGKVRQVLINLLGNAVKFTDKGGITVRVRTEEKIDETVTIVLEVEDTGHGIPEEELDKVFKPFEQAESAKHQQGGGTGLGMPISREYARIMGGDLTVTSKVGQGSIFHLEFQAELGREDELENIAPKRRRVVGLAAGQKQYRILVVDDRETNRELLIQFLTKAGFITHEATDGREAVTAFEKWRPDAILMDMRMPEMDGREATRRIKATPQGERTPIFMVSASAMEEHRVEALASGVDGFIRKPFRAGEIFENLGAALDIEYIYEDTAVGQAKQAGLKIEQLKASVRQLPADLLVAMKEAVEVGDMLELQKRIEQTAEVDEAFAKGLSALAKQYDYESLLDLFEG